MKKLFIGLLMMPIALSAQVVTLDECQQAAQENYPLITKYDLISRSADYTISNISKNWLPQVSAMAQATYQSDVATLPDAITTMASQMGYDVQGLRKGQYRVGIDVNQMVWDGGRIRSQKDVAILEAEMQRAQTDVNMYAVRERVNELYFGILLVDDRIQLNSDMQELLQSSEDKLRSMLKGGVAMESDVNTVTAERLQTVRQMTELRSKRTALLRMLEIFCGKESINELKKPTETVVADDNNRPELQWYQSRILLADAQEDVLKSNLMPQLSVFAQGYYGYPGYDMFHDMFHRNWTLNGMIGARLTWDIGALYTHKNDKAKLKVNREQALNDRDVFLFNNNLRKVNDQENISRYRKLMKEDEEIIRLRTQVRLSAESKLKHGIIDVNNLLQEITRENQAKIDYSTHEVEMLKEMYDLKYTQGKD